MLLDHPPPHSPESLAFGYDDFETGFALTDDADVTIGYRVVGSGEAVILVHGWPQNGYEWRYVARALAGYRVIVPDYRGAGASSVPGHGYDKRTMARDLLALLDHLGVERVHMVGHDIGMMIACTFAVLHPDRLIDLTVMEAALPGTASYNAFVASGAAWHFGFNAHVDLATDLATGRQGRYFDRFYDDFSVHPERIGAAERAWYAACFDERERLEAGFRIYEAFGRDATFMSKSFAEPPLSMPVLALAGEASLGEAVHDIGRELSPDAVTRVVPGAGHWIPEEQPAMLTGQLTSFWSGACRTI